MKKIFNPLRALLSLILVSILFSTTQVKSYAVEISLTLPDAINIAGRQRILTQQMTKLYNMIG